MAVTREILNSHPIGNLKKEISKTNIKGYSKMKKEELVELMMKHKDRFGHIQKHTKKVVLKPPKALKEATKPDKPDKPKRTKEERDKRIAEIAENQKKRKAIKKGPPKPPPAPVAKKGPSPAGNTKAQIQAAVRQRSQVRDFLGGIGASDKSSAVRKTAGKKIELAGSKPPKSKKVNIPEGGTDPAKADWRDTKMSPKDENMLKALKGYFKVNGAPSAYNDLKIIDGKMYVNTVKYHGEGHREDDDKETVISPYEYNSWKRFTDRYWGKGAINGNPESQSGRYDVLKQLKEGKIEMAKKEKVKGAETIPTFMHTGQSWKGNLKKNVRYNHGDYQKKGKKVFDPYGQKDWTFIKPEDYRRFRLGSEKTEELKRRAGAKEIEVYSQGEGRDKWDSKIMVYDAKKKEFREFD